MPTIEISEEAYALLKAEAEKNAELMAQSPGEWFLAKVEDIADNILRRELDPETRQNANVLF